MDDFITSLGIKHHDIALLILCPIGAMLGSFAHAALLLINPEQLPRPSHTRILPRIDQFGRATWLTLRLMLGAILGLVFALYFVGTLQEGLSPLARLVGFSILIGYAAPKLWIAQEKLLMNKLDERIKKVLHESPGANAVPSQAMQRTAPRSDA